MLQKLLTNVRTLSFAFVMVVMLGIGTMVPVQQVAAQEPTSEQRAAMLAQINQLMQLITQLMEQVKMMQAAENGAENYVPKASVNNQFYDLEIESPRANTTYNPGDTVMLRWDETNLDGEYGVIQLVGLTDNTERTLMSQVDIGREMVQVRIPDSITGPMSVNAYNLVLRVAYIKDGDPKGEADSVRLRIKDDRHDSDLANDTPGEDDQSERFSRAIVIGAYEGTLADGTSRGFQEHPQGEVEVYLAADDYTSGVLLVLTAYEPVKWSITGPGAESVVTKVLLSGYYDQEVNGIASDVPVTMISHESGDRDYMYTYDDDSRNYDALEDYIRDEYDVSVTQFFGAYKQDVVRVLGYKG